MRTFALLVGLGALVIATHALAQDTPSGSEPSETGAAVASAAEAPVPVPQPSEKALRYYRTGNVLWGVTLLWGLIVPAAILFSGLSARMRSFAERIGRRWFFALAIYVVLLSVLTFIADLPIAWYSGYVRQHAYGLSNQTAAKWVGDALKSLLISLVVLPPVASLPYVLLRKSPRRWWFYTGLAAVPLIVLMLLVSPVWIDPLFNKFGPMKDKSLESAILQLADKAGIEGGRVYEVNKSVDTKTVNAYVSGFMNTKRIVLWDTIFAKLDRDQILFIMGHEMGHYVLKHVAQVIAFASLAVMVGLYLIHKTAHLVIRRWRGRIGFSELSDFASIPLMILLFSLASLILSPALLAMSRYNEHEADRFGLEITRNNRAAAEAFARLQTENLGVPRPGLLYKLWRSSHPPLGERIDFCNSYRPWETGQDLRYGDRFRQ